MSALSEISAPIDVARARSATPGCRSVTHLNNAGAALPPEIVTRTVVEHLQLEARIGGYEAAGLARPRLEAVYDTVAHLIGARASEIALTESATRAWDMAFYALPFAEGDVILTGESEYSSNVLAFLQMQQRRGVQVEVLGSDADGALDLDALDQRLTALGRRCALVALTHVPTSNGLVNPAAEVGARTRAAGVPYLLDACQSVGQLDLDVTALGCDLLSATGRKFLRAPRGTGFLYVSEAIRDRLDPPFVDLHAAEWIAEDRYELRPDARRFESWEASMASRLGLGAAVDHALGWGMPAIETRVRMLATELRDRLADTAGVTLHDRGRDRCGIVTFSVDGEPAPAVVERLRSGGINTSVSWSSTARLDLGRRGLDDVVRASVHYYNTEDEVGLLVEALSTSARVRPVQAGKARTMSTPEPSEDRPVPSAGPTDSGTDAASEHTDETVPTGGNAAQAAAVFGLHNEPPAEMDSGGAG